MDPPNMESHENCLTLGGSRTLQEGPIILLIDCMSSPTFVKRILGRSFQELHKKGPKSHAFVTYFSNFSLHLGPSHRRLLFRLAAV